MRERARRAAAVVGRAWVHAGVAGIAVGVVELARLLGTAPLPALAAVSVGLTVVLALALGVPLVVVGAALARTHAARVWWDDARAPGPARIAAVVRVVVAVLVLAGLWLVAYALVRWSHGRFNAPGAAGVLIATVITAAAVAMTVAAIVVVPPLSRWLAARAFARRATSGWPGRALLAAVIAGALAALIVFTRTAAPDYDWRPVDMGLGLLGALIAASIGDMAGRLRRRGAIAAGAIAGVLALAALVTIGRSDPARQAVASAGTSSLVTLQGLWRLGDRDGDGSASWFGGADCDDGDARVSPRAVEVAGNGKDDNCSGGDLAAEEVAFRARPQPSAQPGAPKRNVLLLSIDALRADHVTSYGHGRPTTPTLDALAARGARFAWAISPSPTTRRAIPALMTGRYASTIGWKAEGWPPVMQPRRHTVLGQLFKGAGYQTKAILCCAALFDKASGNVEGIDDVDATAARLPGKPPHTAAHLADKAREFLLARKDDPKPFFLWMHFLDPHNPYKQPPDTPSFGSSAIDRYDAEIAYTDAQIARVLATLEETGELADTIVVVTADHGDEFEEHGNRYHGRSLYNELVRVPLIIAVPGAAPRVIETPVSLVDVGATVLDLVGVTRPAGQNGRSLAAAVLGTGPAPDRPVLAELIADRNIHRNLRAAFHGGWKLVWDLDANTYELYSTADDPADTRNRITDAADVAAAMKAQLAAASDRELSLLPGEPPRDGGKKPPAKKK